MIMSNVAFKKLCIELQEKVSGISDDATSDNILSNILSCLKNHSSTVALEPFSSYSIDRFLELKEDDYPVEYSLIQGCEFIAFKRNLLRYNPSDTENIARILSETLESLVVLNLEVGCTNCNHFGLGVYYDETLESFFYECSLSLIHI